MADLQQSARHAKRLLQSDRVSRKLCPKAALQEFTLL